MWDLAIGRNPLTVGRSCRPVGRQGFEAFLKVGKGLKGSAGPLIFFFFFVLFYKAKMIKSAPVLEETCIMYLQ